MFEKVLHVKAETYHAEAFHLVPQSPQSIKPRIHIHMQIKSRVMVRMAHMIGSLYIVV